MLLKILTLEIICIETNRVKIYHKTNIYDMQLSLFHLTLLS